MPKTFLFSTQKSIATTALSQSIARCSISPKNLFRRKKVVAFVVLVNKADELAVSESDICKQSNSFGSFNVVIEIMMSNGSSRSLYAMPSSSSCCCCWGKQEREEIFDRLLLEFTRNRGDKSRENV